MIKIITLFQFVSCVTMFNYYIFTLIFSLLSGNLLIGAFCICSRVSEVDESTVLQSQAYLLFYERIL